MNFHGISSRPADFTRYSFLIFCFQFIFRPDEVRAVVAEDDAWTSADILRRAMIISLVLSDAAVFKWTALVIRQVKRAPSAYRVIDQLLHTSDRSSRRLHR